MDLFSARAAEIGAETAPLAARMRPRNLDEFVGQAHVLGPGSALRALIEADELRSVILWGPAGTGKTSLAQIVCSSTRSTGSTRDSRTRCCPVSRTGPWC